LQNTDMNQLPSSLNSDVSTLTDETVHDEMVMGGKKRKQSKKRNRKNNKKGIKRTIRRHKHRK
jgi:hypothetical protein